MNQPSEHKADNLKPRRKSKGWRRARRWLIGLPLIFFGIVLVLQLPSVQNWLAKRVTASMEKTLETSVSVDNVRISWLDEMTIEGLYIEDKYGDTLLYGKTLAADFDLWHGLVIESVLIADTNFKIRRDLGDAESNLETALQKLFPPKDEPSNTPFNLQLNQLDLRNITFTQNDSVRGQRWDISLESAVAKMDELDLPNSIIRIERAELRSPLVKQTSFSPAPLETAFDSLMIEMDEQVIDTNKTNLQILAGSIEIYDGSYVLDNFRKDPIAEADISAIDFARLGTSNVDLELTDVDFSGGEFLGKLRHLSLEEKSGFILDRLSVQDLKITPTELQLYDLELVTAESLLSDSLHFRFRNGWDSWSDFNNEVRMDINIRKSKVAVRDVLYFARKLRFNQFFRDNQRRKLEIGGELRGMVNSLRGREVELALDQSTKLKGSFSSRQIANPGSELLNLELDELTTDMYTLRRLLPKFTPPENFDRLGKLSFNGRFDGFFTNFVADGTLNSDIGSATLDVQLITSDGPKPATYAGKLTLDDFDLGIWTGNPQFGQISLDGSIANGIGLDANTAKADLDATIRSFTFREYAYQNAIIDGRLEDRFFNGNFSIADDNIDFNFLGEIDFRDSIPTFDFDASVGEFDLLALNLSKQPIALSGNIDLNLIGTDFSVMEGRVELDSFQVLVDTVAITIDSLLAYSNFNLDGQKVVKLESDIARGELVGRFDLEEVAPSLTGFLVRHYPGWAQRLKINPPRSLPAPNRFSFDLSILDSRGLNRLASPQLGSLVNVDLRGSYDGFKDSLVMELTAPDLSFAEFRLVDFILRASSNKGEGDLGFAVDSTFVNDRHLLNRVTLLSLLDDELIDFGLTYGGDEDNIFLDKINLDGELRLPDSLNFELRFDESQLEIFQQRWNIRRGNYIVFGPNYIDTQNFALRSGRLAGTKNDYREIRLSKFGDEGLELDLMNMDLSLIDSIWDYPNLDFSGDVDVTVSVADIFRQEGLRAQFRSDTFLMNGEDYGYLRIDASAPNPKSKLTTYLNLNRDTAQLIAEATYNLADLVESDPLPEQQKNHLDLGVNINGYPLDLAKYWVGGSVSNITGSFNAELKVEGQPKKLDVDGHIDALGGGFTIDYLQTRYRYNQSRVNINNTLFDITGTKLIDRYGNSATLSGGITHDRLKNLGINAQITTDRFLALDLAPGQNPNFYGIAIGSGLVTFTGDFKQTDIYVRATVGKDSKLSIPVDYGAEAGSIDDVRFVNRSLYVEDVVTENAGEPTGVSLEMELLVTDEAIGEIIFDEEVGDILRGQGNGNLTLRIPRDGELKMYGTFTISRGSYLFTFYDIINKEFSVRPGGTVVWTGDPFEARINISADYENLQTPILNFIQEYLVSDVDNNLTTVASRATDVDLSLKLAGLLTKPDINFDIGFPSLDGPLESYANNKRRLLLLDPNELNRQVFGLIVAGQFLPSDLSIGFGDAVVNTVSEWLSNYVSLLLNDLVKNAFGEDAFISSFNFDVAYNNYRNASISSSSVTSRGSAFEFSFSRDFNNRFTLRHDLNVLNNNEAFASGTFVGNNFVLEYVLNDSRTLKLRGYERLQPDIAGGRRIQVGTGLSWRREFDTFKEFFDGFKKDVERSQQ
ncbi:hypothetical protein FUA23_02285 [Neolewinella aurantiaca]|uniref:Translocation and assembly module TamB C-terminal domain-containing protein n=1 Tax=Neolewinella aurantiaca TaxID=2602767 RepID=A0A5C7FLG3_9BACT|nr:translocation/assembly module TamB domain-containing protein [Neolewinella aurantiaca]TXF91547.1 hypothetical protein FUA23_02285 [Neolewinella aurantiaca]